MGLLDINLNVEVGGVKLDFFKKSPASVTEVKASDKSAKLLVFICIVVGVFAAATMKPKELVADLTDDTPDLSKYKHGSPEGKPELDHKLPTIRGGIPQSFANFMHHIQDEFEVLKITTGIASADKKLAGLTDLDAAKMYDKALSYIKSMEPVESDMVISSEAELFDSIGDHVMYNRSCSHLSDDIAFTLIDLVSAIMMSNKALNYAAAGKFWFSDAGMVILKY